MIPLFLFSSSSLLCVFLASMIKPQNKIVDIIHENTQPVKFCYLSDIMIFLQVCYFMCKVNYSTISEFLLQMSLLQLMRCVCFSSTVLPPLKKYSEKYRFGGINGSGTEYIFSGHACYSALTSFYLYKLKFSSFLPLFFYNLVSQFSISLTRNHYTVDVVLSWIISVLLWSNINFCKNDPECNKWLQKFL